jgi:hypothetical protein
MNRGCRVRVAIGATGEYKNFCIEIYHLSIFPIAVDGRIVNTAFILLMAYKDRD